MKTIITKIILFSVIIINSAFAQTWNYLGNSQFAQGTDPDITIYNGTVYVAIKDNANAQKCTVMKYDGVNWVAVGNAGFTVDEINFPSIEINSLGEIFVAFKDYNKFNKLTVMKFDGSNWSVLGLAGFGGTADYIDLTLKQDTPVVAFQKNNDGVVVMKYNGSYFGYVGNSSIHQTNISYGSANYVDIEVNNNNELLVAHRNILSFSQFATVRKWDGSNWTDEANPNFSTGDLAFTTLTIDKATNTPYVAYKDQSSGNLGNLVVMKSDGNSWQAVGNPMDTVLGTIDDMEIRFFNGQPYVAFLEYQGGFKASVITYNGTKWEYIGSRGFSPTNSDKLKMAIDETTGKMYVTFTENGSISVMTFDLGTPSGINDNESFASINVFPNPTNGQLNLTTDETIINLEMYNLLGEKLWSQIINKNSAQLSLEHLPKGVYVIKLNFKNTHLTRKVILE